MEHGMNCPHHADKDEACTCALTERTMHAAWRKRAEEAESRIAALETALAAEREAVRVLGEECHEWRKIKWTPDSFSRWGCTFRRPGTDDALDMTARATDANPIAAAAVKGGGG